MSPQREITVPAPLLDAHGNLNRPGYARRMLYLYNRHRVAGRPFGLKEWDFYQLALGDWVLQLSIGHVSYMAQFAATLFSLETGERHAFSRMRPLPLRGMAMPLSPDRPSLLAAGGQGYRMTFETRRDARHLALHADDGGTPVEIEMTLPHRGDDEMVIATPFEKPGQFYLNCKALFFGVRGQARFGDAVAEADGSQTGLLDWGRGVWPFHQEWFWGCGTGWVQGGRFGFNIGWGFGDLSHATENMFFWNGTAYKLGTLWVKRDTEDYMAPWHFVDPDGRFDMVMEPMFDNDTQTKLAFVDNRCHQVFGRFSGRAVLPGGEVIEVSNLLAFCEHANNNW